jgi:hypothetical protein
LTLDCPNPHELAAFYAALLGVEVGYDSEEFAGLSFGGMSVGFQRAIDYQPPRWPEPGIPQQSHLDFSVPDLDEGEEFSGLWAAKVS